MTAVVPNLAVQQNHQIKTKPCILPALFWIEIRISRGHMWDSAVWRRSLVGSEAPSPPLTALWSGVWKPSFYLYYGALSQQRPVTNVANVAHSLWKDPIFRLLQPVPSLSRTAGGFLTFSSESWRGYFFFFPMDPGFALAAGWVCLGIPPQKSRSFWDIYNGRDNGLLMN